MHNKYKLNFPHFTLVELLVVIAIISVLAALLLPTLESALGQSHTVACFSNQKMIGMAMQQYIADYDGYHIFISSDYQLDWTHTYALNYLDCKKYQEPQWSIFACPADSRNKNARMSYGMMRGIARVSPPGSSGDAWAWGVNVKYSYFTNPSKTYALSDQNFPGLIFYSGSMSVSTAIIDKLKDLTLYNSAQTVAQGSVIWSGTGIGPIHQNFSVTNMLYLDGHTQTLGNWKNKYNTNATYYYHQFPSYLVDD